jgi:hypothetical protein
MKYLLVIAAITDVADLTNGSPEIEFHNNYIRSGSADVKATG